MSITIASMIDPHRVKQADPQGHARAQEAAHDLEEFDRRMAQNPLLQAEKQQLEQTTDKAGRERLQKEQIELERELGPTVMSAIEFEAKRDCARSVLERAGQPELLDNPWPTPPVFIGPKPEK
jgi:hypothetical protein